ncbi:MAG TPA: arsenic transporter [Gammaproteobacteria bacterium]|nr:arsenic transporter [Gammaproteobacteria bacterium]HIG36033.1 arsenic transporter [Gammaproteobacteria bacterium]HIK97637.1 arsenic transporter [Gammaproteobacteria bacterium]
MLVSGIILALSFIGIFTETIHGFSRVKVAMLGALVMLVVGQSYGFYSSEKAFEAVDWNVVFLLAAMMAIVAMMIKTGGFEVLAFRIGKFARGRQFLLLAMLGTAVTVISLLLDNVTTVVIFGPLIVLICQKMKVNAIPYLMAAALLSDTGGVATLVGDPPNLMIGSAANIAFTPFVQKMGLIVLIAWLGTLFFLRLLFKSDLDKKAEGTFTDVIPYKDKSLWNKSLMVLALMVVLFIIHNQIHWEPWMVAVVGLIILGLLAKNLQLEEVMHEVEIPLLMFFIALFMIVGGVENSQFLQYIGQFIIPFVKEDFLTACIALMWIAAIMSAAIDNIPFTAAMIPIILSIEAQGINVAALWWCLALGVGMGGNGTHIGSTANVYIVTVSERLARKEGNPDLAITPLVWAKKGLPVMILTLLICTAIMYLFFDYYSAPI